MSLAAIDVVVLALYMAAMVAMGVWFSRRNRDTEQYFVGGRRIPGWAIGLSISNSSARERCSSWPPCRSARCWTCRWYG
jgi:SSS family solute:Na+ symporter